VRRQRHPRESGTDIVERRHPGCRGDTRRTVRIRFEREWHRPGRGHGTSASSRCSATPAEQ
jgi:hypothetical protein